MSSGTFPVALSQGTYHYHCTVHGAAMSGTIVVQ
jgi:plastocyanin